MLETAYIARVTQKGHMYVQNIIKAVAYTFLCGLHLSL